MMGVSCVLEGGFCSQQPVFAESEALSKGSKSCGLTIFDDHAEIGLLCIPEDVSSQRQ